ncbi:MAG: hypothetical protein J6S67_12865 [Methanobrevibacter sp.]|nr:hypothetical protein [Methanobrevibacter sp.]
MKELSFRTLTANEIECRVGNTIKKKDQYGKSTNEVEAFYLLLYKNARVDQCVLDETVGQFNWQCKYYQVKNTMVCSVGIYNEERNEWLWKDNGGDDDFTTEQVKGELSDAFKRACFNWGIGRELYYSPKIYIKCDNANNEKSRYSVKVIEYDQNKRITRLAIINDKTKEIVFLYVKDKKVAENGENEPKKVENEPTPQANEPKGSITTHDLALIQEYVRNVQNQDNFYKWVEKHFNTQQLEQLTTSQGKAIVKKLGLEND